MIEGPAMTALSDFIANTNAIEESDALFPALKAFVRPYGIDVASYHILAEHARPVGFDDGFVFHDFPEAWVQRYSEKGYFAYDPIMEAARANSMPFHWFDVRKHLKTTPAQDAYIEDLRAHSGLADGLAVSVFGARQASAYFGLGSFRGPLDLSATDLRMLQFACQQVHDRFVALHGPVSPMLAPTLTGREKEVLRWLVMGKSNGDIAEILGVSSHTVDTLVRRLFVKLGVSNRISAALRAVGSGIIAA